MNIDKLPIGYLRTFVLIVDGGGVNAAIRPGVMTKTTVYNQINAIESAVSGKLFNGGYKKENLTPIGKATYKDSIEAVGLLDGLMSNILTGELSDDK